MDDLLFGLQVAVLGMGIVFALLTVLWLLLTLVLRLEQRGRAREAAAAGGLAAPAGDASAEAEARGSPAAGSPVAGSPAPGSPAPGSPAVRLVGAPPDLDPGLVAAIGVVILRHAETRRRQAAPAMRSYWPGSLLFASRWVAAGRARQARSWTRRGR